MSIGAAGIDLPYPKLVFTLVPFGSPVAVSSVTTAIMAFTRFGHLYRSLLFNIWNLDLTTDGTAYINTSPDGVNINSDVYDIALPANRPNSQEFALPMMRQFWSVDGKSNGSVIQVKLEILGIPR